MRIGKARKEWLAAASSDSDPFLLRASSGTEVQVLLSANDNPSLNFSRQPQQLDGLRVSITGIEPHSELSLGAIPQRTQAPCLKNPSRERYPILAQEYRHVQSFVCRLPYFIAYQ